MTITTAAVAAIAMSNCLAGRMPLTMLLPSAATVSVFCP
jgi:hypothetical protein